MNFALLGDDPAANCLVQAARAAGHSVLRAALAERLCAPGSESAGVPYGRWEELLTDRAVEAVLVAGDSEELQTAAKQLAAAGKPLLIVPKPALGAACAYELSLIRDDTQVVLMPAFFHRGETELMALRQRLANRELGAVRRLQIEVELPAVGTATASGVLSDEDIESAALPDVDLLRWLGGHYDEVTSQRLGQIGEGCTQATLTLAGSGLPDATWTARRGPKASWRLTIDAEHQPLTIHRDHSSSSVPGVPSVAPLIANFVAATNGQSVHSDWGDAVRVFEVLDAARRSLRRRRTIDLHNEALSERSQFKTQMTAIGCGLLMLTLVLMLGLLGLGSLLESRDRTVREAVAAGLLLSESDFEPQAATLNAAGLVRVEQIARRLRDEPKSAYIAPSETSPSAELNQHRRAEVVNRLNELGVVASDHRTLIAPPRSTGWDWLLRILRLAWIAPLVLFLLCQFLLFVAKPSASEKGSSGILGD